MMPLLTKCRNFNLLGCVEHGLKPLMRRPASFLIIFYFQSVVLISKLPFVALFSQLVSIIAPEYFENGEPSLEAGMLNSLVKSGLSHHYHLE